MTTTQAPAPVPTVLRARCKASMRVVNPRGEAVLRAAWDAYEAMLGGFRHYGPGCDLYEAVVAADQVLPVMSAATMGALDTALATACGEVEARRAEYVAEGNPLGVRAESKRRAKILAALALTALALVDLEVAS